MFKRHKKLGIILLLVTAWTLWSFIPFADARWSSFGAWDTLKKFLGKTHTWTATQTFDENVIIDDTSTEAFLVRQDADAADVLVVDTTNSLISLGGVTPVTGVTLLLPLSNDAATPTLAFGDGNTGFYETSDNIIVFASATTAAFQYNADVFGSTQASGPRISRASASSTAPGFQFQGDPDTGIGLAGADALSLIAGGVEGMRITETATGDVTIVVLGTAPGASSCGTSPSITGSDAAGKLTIGTGATTSCTVTFANAFTTNAPACVIAGDNNAIGYAATTSTTVLTITSSGDMASDVISYICLGIL